MTPSITYPITQVLCTSLKPGPNQQLPMLEPPSKLSTLAKLEEKPIDKYLKKVFHHLKEPFEKMLESQLNVEIKFHSPEYIRVVAWEITIQQVIKRHDFKLLEALGMLNHGLFQSRLLLKNLSQVGEAEIKWLTKLKKNLFELTSCLDNILMFYSVAGPNESNRPSVKKVKRVAKKSRKYLRNIRPDKLQCLIPDMVVKGEAILCSVLGLEDEVAERLAGLKPHIRGHQTDLYFILCFLEGKAKYSGSLTDQTAVAEKLQEIGFTKNRSVVVAEWISKQPFPNHQLLYSWVTDYIDKLFVYDIFLNDQVPSYPFHETKIDTWLPVSVERYKEMVDEEYSTETADVQVINTTVGRLDSIVDERQQAFKRQHPEKHLYFHGTDHEAAQYIIENGINLCYGKQQCDFSDGFGFYLSSGSKFPIGWAKKNDASAIIMFDIEDSMSKYKCLDLSLDESKSDLESLKKRCKADERLPELLRQEYKKCDYVKGPISEVELREHQVCIRGKTMAEVLGDAPNIYGVIFCYKY